MKFKIIEAKSNHIKQVGKLFDLYRQFYKYDSNLIESTNYIKDKIDNKESKIFIAINDNDSAVGFHIGINKNLFEDFDGDDDINLFFGFDRELNRSFSLMAEYDFAINDNDSAVGFVQLYETHGSLDLGKILILYDLYVKKDHRKKNIGRQLMLKSHEYAKQIGVKRIQLSTATDNFIGQSLYESLGYVKDINFYTYDLVSV